MLNVEIEEPMKLSLGNLFAANDKYVFLVGAGVSTNAPTNLYAGSDLSESLKEILLPQNEQEDVGPKSSPYPDLKDMRFEQIIDLAKRYIDQDLHFIEEFDKREPNAIHYFLARAVLSQHIVITTNFDCMIEKALEIIQPDRANNLISVICKDDFDSYVDGNEVLAKGYYPIYKLHGSYINYFSTNEALKDSLVMKKPLVTKESLIATTSDLAKQERPETFGLPKYKMDFLRKSLRNRKLIVLGYAGGDAFDITPAMCDVQGIQTIIWIKHMRQSGNDNSKEGINDIVRNERIKKEDSEFLFEVYNRNKNIETVLIRAETCSFIRAHLFNQLLPSNTKLTDKEKEIQGSVYHSDGNSNQSGKELTDKFLRDDCKYSLNEVKQYDALCQIYSDLSDSKKGEVAAKGGLHVAKDNNDLESQANFLKYLGLFCRHNQDYSNSIRTLKEAIKYRNSNHRNADFYEFYSTCLNEMGRTFESQKLFRKALKCYKKALKISERRKLGRKYEAVYRNNISNLCNEFGDFRKALNGHTKVLEICKTSNDQPGLAFAQLNIAGDYFNMKDFASSIDACKKAVDLAKDVGDYYLETLFLGKLSTIYSAMQAFDESQQTLDEICKVYDLLNAKESGAKLRFNMGSNFSNMGRFDKAIEEFTKSAKIFRGLSNFLTEAEAYHAIAGNYLQTGNIHETMFYEEKAVEIASKYNLAAKQDYIDHLNRVKDMSDTNSEQGLESQARLFKKAMVSDPKFRNSIRLQKDPLIRSEQFKRFNEDFLKSLELKNISSLASALSLRQQSTENVRNEPALYCVGKHNEMILEYNHIGHGIEARKSALESLKHEEEFKNISLALYPMFRSDFYQESLEYMTYASVSYDEGDYYFSKLKEQFPNDKNMLRYQEFKASQDKSGRWFITQRAMIGNFCSRVSAELDKGRYAAGNSVIDIILTNSEEAGYNLDNDEYVDLLDDMCANAVQLLMQKTSARHQLHVVDQNEANELGCVMQKPIKFLSEFYPKCLPRNKQLFTDYYKAWKLIPWINEVSGWERLSLFFE